MDLRPIEPLDLEDIEGVTDWHERFFHFCKTDSKVDSTNMISFYITFIGKKAYRRLKDLAFPSKVEDVSVTNLQKLLEAHIQPVNFVAAEREKFHNLRQRPDESPRSFLLRIQQQAAKCDFAGTLEEQMRDRIVAGVADQDLKRKLLKETSLTFKAAKKIIDDWNDVNAALQPSGEVLFHHKGNRGGRSGYKTRSSFKQHQQERPKGRCDSCGGAHSRQSCKFRQAECHQCHRRGHIKRVCRGRAKEVRTNQTRADNEEEPDLDITALTVNEPNQLFHKVCFDTGRSKAFILDTGSPITFLPLADLLALGYSKDALRRTTTTIRGVTGHSLTVHGQLHQGVHGVAS